MSNPETLSQSAKTLPLTSTEAEFPSELRVFSQMFANAKRDLDAGYGVRDNFQAILDHLRRVKTALDPNVFFFTEFHRLLTAEKYDEFLGFMRTELGMPYHCGYKKNVPMSEQAPGPNAGNPMAFETIVFTSFPADFQRHEFFFHDATEARPYPLSNGCVTFPFKGHVFVGVHNSLSFGDRTSPGYADVLCEFDTLLQRYEAPFIIGDFNLTASLLLTLKEDRPDILEHFHCTPTQPDFVCLPGDWIPRSRLIPNDSVPNGTATCVFAVSTENPNLCRLASTLSVLNSQWKTPSLEARFFHPWSFEDEITGLTVEQVAEMSRQLEAKHTRKELLPFDHAGVFVRRSF